MKWIDWSLFQIIIENQFQPTDDQNSANMVKNRFICESSHNQFMKSEWKLSGDIALKGVTDSQTNSKCL